MGEQFNPNLENVSKDLNINRISTFKKAIESMIATSKAAYVRSDNKSPRERNRIYTKEDIHRIVERGDSVERAKLSQHFFSVSGLYKRIILHYATFLTYSWILVPHVKSRKDKIKDKKITGSYDDASDFCTSFQIERKCALFAKDILVNGAYYGLIHDSGEYIAIQDLPFEYCRSRFKNQQDIDIVEFNMKFFDSITDAELRRQILKTYPKLIQKAYHNYRHNNGENWIFLPAEMGIYFSYFEERPFFMDLIPLLDDLDDYKEIDKRRNLQSLGRIIVQKVGTDGTQLIFEPEEAEEMHEGVISMLQDNPDVDVITTYNDIEMIDLSSDDDEKTTVDSVQDLIYESAGVSKELFCATTDAGLQYSLNNDLAMMMILGQKFAHFFTVLINNKFSSKKIKFKLLILPISYYNNVEYTSKAKDLAAFGYSFLTPILSTGIDQTSLSDLKELENELLELDEVLKPLQSSYTQSGKTNAVTAAASKTASEQAANSSDDATKKEEEEKTEEKDTGGGGEINE
jgi:hypothetical protein